ncbi:MAG: hypothetical protein ABIP07_07745 [Sphingomicrobium sp.]
MINALIAAVLLAGAAPGIQVDVGRIDRSALPVLKARNRPLPTPMMVGDVANMLARGKCRFSGQSPTRFDITVPYAVLVEPDGRSRHVVVQETGCIPLESYVGLLVLEMARQGDFAQSAGPKPRWYASELNFNLE